MKKRTLHLFVLGILAMLGTTATAATLTDVLTSESLGLGNGTDVVSVSDKAFPSGAIYSAVVRPVEGGNFCLAWTDWDTNPNAIVGVGPEGMKLKAVTVTFNSKRTTSYVYVNVFGSKNGLVNIDNLRDLQSSANVEYNEDGNYTVRQTSWLEGYGFSSLGIAASWDSEVYIDKIEVEWESEDVAPPVINGTTPFQGSTEVTITAESGLRIKYAIDSPTFEMGGEIVDNFSWYTGPFTLTETHTIYAKAINSNNFESEVVSREFVFAELTVWQLVNLGDGAETTVKFSPETYVTYVNGKYTYVYDNVAQAGFCFYNQEFYPALTNSSKLSGKMKGKLQMYHGLPQFVVYNLTDFSETNTGQEYLSKSISLNEVPKNSCNLVQVIEKVEARVEGKRTNYYFVNDDAAALPIQIYDQFNVGSDNVLANIPSDSKVVVEGVVIRYDDKYEILPTRKPELYKSVGISSVRAITKAQKPIFDLQGRRITTSQPKRGLYISSGKKYIIR